MSDVVLRFKRVYNELNAGNLELMHDLYTPGIHFTDPIRDVHGIEELTDYFADLYDGVARCRFKFTGDVTSANSASIQWVMVMQHRRFRPRETVRLPGVSIIEFGDRIHRHRDYFDLGELIYERVPILGIVVRGIKSRM